MLLWLWGSLGGLLGRFGCGVLVVSRRVPVGGANSLATNFADVSRLAVVGCGATGTRVARQLLRGDDRASVVLVDSTAGLAEHVAASLGPDVAWKDGTKPPKNCRIVILAMDCGDHVGAARRALEAGQHVISLSDRLADIRRLLQLNELAIDNDATLVVGAGMMPGLTDVLATHGAAWLDEVSEIHVSKFGTGGPACARQHHRSLKGICIDWRNGQWVRRAGGSGRELAWFPAPVQSADCYRAALGDPLLLVRAHPNVDRITARMAATRRDRLTMHLPMLRRPHPEGLLGAVRVELRGIVDGVQTEVVLGCAERPAVAAGTVAAATAATLLRNPRLATGAMGLSELVDPIPFLHDLRIRGLIPEIFVGSSGSD